VSTKPVPARYELRPFGQVADRASGEVIGTITNTNQLGGACWWQFVPAREHSSSATVASARTFWPTKRHAARALHARWAADRPVVP